MHYFDSSALVKLVLTESETPAIVEYGDSGIRIISSDLARTEVYRAVVRTDPARHRQAEELISGVGLIPLTSEILDTAGRLGPRTLRSLDAIHLASALVLREELDAFVAYDARLCETADALGLPVQTPS